MWLYKSEGRQDCGGIFALAVTAELAPKVAPRRADIVYAVVMHPGFGIFPLFRGNDEWRTYRRGFFLKYIEYVALGRAYDHGDAGFYDTGLLGCYFSLGVA